MKRQTILIVEDEEHLAIGLSFNLQREGLDVQVARDGEEALRFWNDVNNRPDIILLDVMLPKLDGLQILKIIRSEDESTPIMILSARNQAEDKIRGLKLGVDDYMAKPFELEELLLRLRLLLKKAQTQKVSKSQNPPPFKVGESTVDLAAASIINSQGGVIALTDIEVKLLKYFYQHPGEVIERKEILVEVWGHSEKMNTRTLDNFIVRLRKYLEVDPRHPQFFKGKRGKGYLFIADKLQSY